MKRVIGIVVAVLFLAAGSVYAGCGKCDMGDAHKQGKQVTDNKECAKMAKDLKLTPEQKTQVEAIMNAQMEQKQQLMAKHQAEMDATREELKAKLNGVLTAEQMKKWEGTKAKCPMMGGAKASSAHGKGMKGCPMGKSKK